MALERKALAQRQLAGEATRRPPASPTSSRSDTERRLAAKVEAFRTQKETIKAQYSAAEAPGQDRGRPDRAVGPYADVDLAVDRARDKTEQMRARALAMGRLIDTGVLDDATVAGGDDLGCQLNSDQCIAKRRATSRGAQLATAPPRTSSPRRRPARTGSERSTP